MKSGDVKMAATLFVLMGEETAAEVLRYLNEAEIEAISKEISNVGPIATEDAEKSAEDAVCVASCTIPPEAPTDGEILRALPPLPCGLGAICDVCRNDITIECQKVGESTEATCPLSTTALSLRGSC